MSTRSPRLLATLALVAGVAGLSVTGPGAAHAQETATADTVLATVNGVDITAGHLLLMRTQLPQQFQMLPDDQLYTGLLDQAVQQQLLAGEAEALDRASQLLLENQERNLRANVEVMRLFEIEVTEDAILAAYDVQYAEAARGVEYNAAHILVETEAEAAAIKAELDAGADFAELAQAQSIGPTGPNGGNLGWFGAGMMVPPFEQAVIALEPGTVSDPVQTQFGWHVIRLIETREAAVPTLDDVRAEIEGMLQQDALSARLDALAATADVNVRGMDEIAPSFLSNRDLLAD